MTESMPLPAPDQLLNSYANIARRLCVSQRYVEQLVARGQMSAVPLGKRRLIPEAELLRFVDTLSVQ